MFVFLLSETIKADTSWTLRASTVPRRWYWPFRSWTPVRTPTRPPSPYSCLQVSFTVNRIMRCVCSDSSSAFKCRLRRLGYCGMIGSDVQLSYWAEELYMNCLIRRAQCSDWKHFGVDVREMHADVFELCGQHISLPIIGRLFGIDNRPADNRSKRYRYFLVCQQGHIYRFFLRTGLNSFECQMSILNL